uniref:ZP domain-containing protein n=1 Tax=Heterorhabditis bacteriophora TaxID=37862 RepID=A0A1I7WHX3_HETBA
MMFSIILLGNAVFDIRCTYSISNDLLVSVVTVHFFEINFYSFNYYYGILLGRQMIVWIDMNLITFKRDFSEG